MQVLCFYATNLGVDMGESRALEGNVSNFAVSYAPPQENKYSLFAGKTTCMFMISVDAFKCIQPSAHSVYSRRFILALGDSLMAKQFKGEKIA
jgi:hypothetical protein